MDDRGAIAGNPWMLRATSLLMTTLLLATCASPDCATWNTQAFFKAATPGDTRACLQAGADVMVRDSAGLTPLHLAAAWSEHPGVVEAVVEAGADIDAMDSYFRTSAMHRAPLDMAARYNGNPQVALVLLGAGARAEVRNLLLPSSKPERT